MSNPRSFWAVLVVGTLASAAVSGCQSATRAALSATGASVGAIPVAAALSVGKVATSLVPGAKPATVTQESVRAGMMLRAGPHKFRNPHFQASRDHLAFRTTSVGRTFQTAKEKMRSPRLGQARDRLREGSHGEVPAGGSLKKLLGLSGEVAATMAAGTVQPVLKALLPGFDQ